jgi:hypothetical protein
MSIISILLIKIRAKMSDLWMNYTRMVKLQLKLSITCSIMHSTSVSISSFPQFILSFL